MLTPIEEKVAPPDSSLEDESNFVDIIGVLSPEQAAETIESIIVASNKIISFDETLIPFGEVTKITPELQKTASLEQIRELKAINKYAAGLSQTAAQIRLQRKANGFKDTPTKVAAPPVASPTGELTIDLGAIYNLFGETEVKG